MTVQIEQVDVGLPQRRASLEREAMTRTGPHARALQGLNEWNEKQSRPATTPTARARCGLNEGLLSKEKQSPGSGRHQGPASGLNEGLLSEEKQSVRPGTRPADRYASTKGFSRKRSNHPDRRPSRPACTSLNEGLLSEEKQCAHAGLRGHRQRQPQRRASLGREAIAIVHQVCSASSLPQRRASLGREAIAVATALKELWSSGLNEGLLSEEKQSSSILGASSHHEPQRRASLGREAMRASGV